MTIAPYRKALVAGVLTFLGAVLAALTAHQNGLTGLTLNDWLLAVLAGVVSLNGTWYAKNTPAADAVAAVTAVVDHKPIPLPITPAQAAEVNAAENAYATVAKADPALHLPPVAPPVVSGPVTPAP
ncbi:MAG: hypothetical protein NVSMB4_02620 [Acidimicrobiales bacterium]